MSEENFRDLSSDDAQKKIEKASKDAKKEATKYKKQLRDVFAHIPKEDRIMNEELNIDKEYTPVIIKPNWNDFHFRYWDYGDTNDFWLVYIQSTTQEVQQVLSFWFMKKNSSIVKASKKTASANPDLPIKELLNLSGYRKNWFIVRNKYLEETKKKVDDYFRPKEPEKEKAKKYKDQAKEMFAEKPKKVDISKEKINNLVDEQTAKQQDEYAKKKALEDGITFVATDEQEFLSETKEHEERVNKMENDEEVTDALTISKQTSQHLSLGRSVEEVLDDWKKFRELDSKLLDDTDYSVIQGKKRKNKSAFRKYKTAYTIADKIVNEETKFLEDGSYYSKFLVHAYPANNPDYISEGLGIVHSKEKCHYEIWSKKVWKNDVATWVEQQPCEESCNGLKHFDNKLHNIESTAHTRAKNRAISDLVAGGEVSAEEIT